MRRYIILVSLFLMVLGGGCIDEMVVKPKQPDIRVVTVNFDPDFSLGEGLVARGTYTLTNYGDADGYATVEFIGDYSGSLTQQTVFVPAQNSVKMNIRLDVRLEDEQLSYRIIKQTRAP